MCRQELGHDTRHEETAEKPHSQGEVFLQEPLPWAGVGDSWWIETESVCVQKCKSLHVNPSNTHKSHVFYF